MSEPYDILVVGAGIVGLASALAMAQRRFTVALLDPNVFSVQTENKDPRVYAINRASQDLLQRLGVWQDLDPKRVSPFQRIEIWDALSKTPVDFDARLVIAPALGHIIEESILKKALLKQIQKQPNIHLVPNSQVMAVQEEASGICVKDKHHTWKATLLMVADGAHSHCRQSLKIPIVSYPYHQEAIVAFVRTQKPHQKTAYQVFNADGTLAFLPLAEDHLCSIVWSTTPARSKQLMKASEDAFNRNLTLASEDLLGLVCLEGERHCFPLIMRHVKQYSGSHWLVLGDAAHTIHPLAGLGLNVGLADLASWLVCLDASNHCFSKKALASYQRERKQAVWQILVTLEALKLLFLNPLPPVIALRGLGLQVCNHLSPLKKFFIEYAAGNTL